MRDITKEFLKQPKEYGRKPNLNVTRRDIYAAKTKNIYKILGREELQLKVFFGNTCTRSFPANVGKAIKAVKWYGKKYFLEVNYPNSGDAIHIRLKELLPLKNGDTMAGQQEAS